MISSRGGRTDITNILLEGEHIDLDIQENVSVYFFYVAHFDMAFCPHAIALSCSLAVCYIPTPVLCFCQPKFTNVHGHDHVMHNIVM